MINKPAAYYGIILCYLYDSILLYPPAQFPIQSESSLCLRNCIKSGKHKIKHFCKTQHFFDHMFEALESLVLAFKLPPPGDMRNREHDRVSRDFASTLFISKLPGQEQ